jgi:hypothetical protein
MSRANLTRPPAYRYRCSKTVKRTIIAAPERNGTGYCLTIRLPFSGLPHSRHCALVSIPLECY